jgi:hypothetical protein
VRLPPHRGRFVRALVTLGSAVFALTLGGASTPSLPTLVFVSRQPIAGEPGAIPGIGPHHRAAAPGGRLLVRERDGRVRPLLPQGTLFDVSDPAVSFDGHTIAFAGIPSPDSAWRIYVCGVDGRNLQRVTRDDRSIDLTRLGPGAERFARYDDLDPCWIDARTLCFASTRYPQRSEYADVPVTNLFLVSLDGGAPVRLTAERNGAEEPSLDPTSGRVVFSRWWFNRRRPDAHVAGAFVTEAAAGSDSVNLWQAMEITRDGADERLACGELVTRRGTMAYQPIVLDNGTCVGVVSLNLGLSPRPIATAIQSFPGRFGRVRHLAGAIVPEAQGDPYSGARGLAAPSACAPAALPDGRIVFAYAPGGSDFGLFVMRADGTHIERVLDLPGTLELDPAAIVKRSIPRALAIAPEADLEAAAATGRTGLPAVDAARIGGARGTFRYRCLNVFAGGPLDHPSGQPPPPTLGARVRFYAALARPDREGGDSLALVREVPVRPDGSVDETLPADLAMFEQVVDAQGLVLRSAHGMAQVAGLNVGSPGHTSLCVGCHVGHSTLTRAGAPAEPQWFDAAPSASVTAEGTVRDSDPRRAVDRRTLGPAADVAWVAMPGASLRLRWPQPLTIRAVRAYAASGAKAPKKCEVRLLLHGRLVAHGSLSAPGSRGSRLSITGDGDELVFEPRGTNGSMTIGEVEVEARLPSR